MTDQVPTLIKVPENTWPIETPVSSKLNQEALLREYNGTSDPERWLKQLKDCATTASWSEPYTIQVARNKLTGAALQLMDYATTIEDEGSITFETFSAILLAEYKPEEKLIVKLQRFTLCSQEHDESILAFGARIRNLGLQTCTTTEEKKTLDSRLLAQFLHGIRRKEIYDVVISKNPEKFSTAVEIARGAETQIAARRGKNIVTSTITNGRNQAKKPKKEIRTMSRGNKTQNTSFRNFARRPNNVDKKCTWCTKQEPTKPTNHTWQECRKRLMSENRCFTCKQKDCRQETCPRQKNKSISNIQQDQTTKQNEDNQKNFYLAPLFLE